MQALDKFIDSIARYAGRNDAIRHLARMGILPAAFQGPLRSVVPQRNGDQLVSACLGVPNRMRAAVVAAFPEIHFLFVNHRAPLDLLRVMVAKDASAIIAGEHSNLRLVAELRDSSQHPVLHLSRSPISRLTNAAGARANGYHLDCLAAWRLARSRTEFDLILSHLDFDARPALLADSKKLLGHLSRSADHPSHSILILAPERTGPARQVENQRELELLISHARRIAGKKTVDVFSIPRNTHWYDDDVLDAVESAIGQAEIVVGDLSPHLPAALLSGKKVATMGRGICAGLGLTIDPPEAFRRRAVDSVQFTAALSLLGSRYVDRTNSLVDPIEFLSLT